MDSRNLSKFIPYAYSPDKQTQAAIKPPNVIPMVSGSPNDSHQQRSGLIAQKFSSAKDHTFHGGFWEV